MKQVKAGEMLTTRLEDGWIESEVKNIQPVKKSRKKGALSQHEFNAFFRYQAMPVLTEVIYCTAGF